VTTELLKTLIATSFWLLKTSEKAHIILPNKDTLLSLLRKAQNLIGEIEISTTFPLFLSDDNSQGNPTDEDFTAPFKVLFDCGHEFRGHRAI
jgi:hypothetical protein